MLKLKQGRVVAVTATNDRIVRFDARVDGEVRQVVSYPRMTGGVEIGDTVVLNVEARDLKLGSGGFDLMVVNLTRLGGSTPDSGVHTMKLNYTPIQQTTPLIEEGCLSAERITGMEVVVIGLHGQLAPAAFAISLRSPEARIAYLQTWGGALMGSLSDVVADLRRTGVLSAHVAVAPCVDAELESMTVAAALSAARHQLGIDVAIVGPGPGIQGSGSALGHGGMAAFDSVNAAVALGGSTALVPRMSQGDPRERHRGMSHHTVTVLELLPQPVVVPLPREPADLHLSIEEEIKRSDRLARHRYVHCATEDALNAYRASDLPQRTMGRSLDEDPLFFRAALAGGLFSVAPD